MIQFTPGEIVLLVGLLAHAVAFFLALRFTRKRMQRDVEMVAHDVNVGVQKIEEVRHETSSMRTQLEARARSEGRAAGVIEGRAEEKEDERQRKVALQTKTPKR